MREQLIKYVELLFAGTQDAVDMQQEILQNTLDRYDDLISQGKSPEAAYRLAISGIGDIGEILGTVSPAPAALDTTTNETNTDYRGRPLPSAQKKTMRAVAIGMYICCVIPLFVLGNIGNGILGLCLMFLLIAAATVLIIMASDDKESAETKQENKAQLTPRLKQRKDIEKIMDTIALALFFVVSFATGAWYITWLIFPILAAVKGIVFACMDLKEEKEE